MAINEIIVTGKKFRRCIDNAPKKIWQRISFWHKACDCEFDDGTNAQTKLGAIKGITTNLNVTVAGYAADMTVVNQLKAEIDELNDMVTHKGYESTMYLHVIGGEKRGDLYITVPFDGYYTITDIESDNCTSALTYTYYGVSGMNIRTFLNAGDTLGFHYADNERGYRSFTAKYKYEI